jgi:hypothetical protein
MAARHFLLWGHLPAQFRKMGISRKRQILLKEKLGLWIIIQTHIIDWIHGRLKAIIHFSHVIQVWGLGQDFKWQDEITLFTYTRRILNTADSHIKIFVTSTYFYICTYIPIYMYAYITYTHIYIYIYLKQVTTVLSSKSIKELNLS